MKLRTEKPSLRRDSDCGAGDTGGAHALPLSLGITGGSLSLLLHLPASQAHCCHGKGLVRGLGALVVFTQLVLVKV